MGNDDRRAGRQADEETDQQVNQCARRAANRRKRLFADEFADNNGIRRIIELLEKCAEHNGKKEQQQLFPDHALRDGVLHNSLFSCHMFPHKSFRQNQTFSLVYFSDRKSVILKFDF